MVVVGFEAVRPAVADQGVGAVNFATFDAVGTDQDWYLFGSEAAFRAQFRGARHVELKYATVEVSVEAEQGSEVKLSSKIGEEDEIRISEIFTSEVGKVDT